MNEQKLEKAKEWRNRELQLYDVSREILIYAIFLLLVVIVGNRDPWIPIYRQHMSNLFLRKAPDSTSMMKVNLLTKIGCNMSEVLGVETMSTYCKHTNSDISEVHFSHKIYCVNC